MLLGQRILTGAVESGGAVVALIDRDSLLAGAAVSGNRVNADGVVLREDTQFNQRIHHGNESACVAAGDCGPCGVRDLFAEIRAQLRESVRPVGVSAVRSGGVDNARIAALGEGNRFLCGGVRQAEKREIRAVNELSALLGILALVLVNAE